MTFEDQLRQKIDAHYRIKGVFPEFVFVSREFKNGLDRELNAKDRVRPLLILDLKETTYNGVRLLIAEDVSPDFISIGRNY